MGIAGDKMILLKYILCMVSIVLNEDNFTDQQLASCGQPDKASRYWRLLRQQRSDGADKVKA